MAVWMTRPWYYRFLASHSEVLGTGNQRPLKIDRAKWATAKNVGEWYDVLASALVDAGVALRNPEFDPSARRDSP